MVAYSSYVAHQISAEQNEYYYCSRMNNDMEK